MEEISNRLKFLDKASNILISGGETPKISSHLRYLHYQFLQHGEWKVPLDKDPLPLICPKCFTEFRGTSYTITVKPSPRPSFNLIKILQRKAKLQHLTGAQTVLLSNFEKSQGKKLVLKCGICQKETESTLKKQRGDFKIKTTNTAESLGTNLKCKSKKIPNVKPALRTDSHSTSHEKKKKKKKKDQFAGLKVSAVKSVQFKKKRQIARI